MSSFRDNGPYLMRGDKTAVLGEIDGKFLWTDKVEQFHKFDTTKELHQFVKDNHQLLYGDTNNDDASLVVYEQHGTGWLTYKGAVVTDNSFDQHNQTKPVEQPTPEPQDEDTDSTIKLLASHAYDMTPIELSDTEHGIVEAVLPATELLKCVDNSYNVRDEYTDRDVKRGIRRTLDTEPHMFIMYHLGFTARSSYTSIDKLTPKECVDLGKAARVDYRITADNMSIINGGNSLAVLRKFVADNPDKTVWVRLTILDGPEDSPYLKDAALYRNTTVVVKDITRAGYKGEFSQMEQTLRSNGFPHIKLATSETDLKDQTKTNPVWLLQLAAATDYDRVSLPSPYTSKATLLKRYRDIHFILENPDAHTEEKVKQAEDKLKVICTQVVRGLKLHNIITEWTREHDQPEHFGLVAPLITSLSCWIDRMEANHNMDWLTMDHDHNHTTGWHFNLLREAINANLGRKRDRKLTDDIDFSSVGRSAAIYNVLLAHAKAGGIDPTLRPDEPKPKPRRERKATADQS